MTFDNPASGHGIGTALLEAAAEIALARACRRVWLTTTNYNPPTLRFYQRRGGDLVAVRRGAVDEWCRRWKPSIPERGHYDIPLRHAQELELRT